MKNSIEYHNKVINQINKTISIITEQSDDERKDDVEGIRNDISYLRSLLYDINKSDLINFKKIWISFDGEYELELPRYGLRSFDRSLKGNMYFKVLGGTNKYIDIQTNSFPDGFKIRLGYTTLDTGTRQREDSFLVYTEGNKILKGDATKITYQINKKK